MPFLPPHYLQTPWPPATDPANVFKMSTCYEAKQQTCQLNFSITTLEECRTSFIRTIAPGNGIFNKKKYGLA